MLERDARKVKSEHYAKLVRAVGGHPVDDESAFQRQYQEFKRQLELTGTHEADLQNAVTERSVDLRQGKQQHRQLVAEIDSLKSRRSNIPDEQIRMRAALCQALDLPRTRFLCRRAAAGARRGTVVGRALQSGSCTTWTLCAGTR